MHHKIRKNFLQQHANKQLSQYNSQ